MSFAPAPNTEGVDVGRFWLPGIPNRIERCHAEKIWKGFCDREADYLRGFKENPKQVSKRMDINGMQVIQHPTYVEIKIPDADGGEDRKLSLNQLSAGCLPIAPANQSSPAASQYGDSAYATHSSFRGTGSLGRQQVEGARALRLQQAGASTMSHGSERGFINRPPTPATATPLEAVQEEEVDLSKLSRAERISKKQEIRRVRALPFYQAALQGKKTPSGWKSKRAGKDAPSMASDIFRELQAMADVPPNSLYRAQSLPSL